MADTPLMEFESTATAPVLRYDIPTPSSYEGKSYIEVRLPATLWNDTAKREPNLADFLAVNQEAVAEYLSGVSRAELDQQLCSYMLDKTTTTPALTEGGKPAVSGKVAPIKARNNPRQPKRIQRGVESEFARPLATGNELRSVIDDWLHRTGQDTRPEDVQREDSVAHRYELFRLRLQAAIEDGMFPVLYRTLSGKVRLRFVRVPDTPVPRLMIIESHRLTTFPGDYGAGLTVQTFSLLPGEETTISVKTWKKSTTAISEASSILDSYTEEKADEFERGVQAEHSSASKSDESFSYHAEAKASGSWGIGSAEVSGGVAGGSNAAREEACKNTMNATDKHAQKASAKREVNVETSFQRTEDQGQEQMIERRIRNVNVSRTLNFVFRQLNQEFTTIVHLTDVRVAFYSGFPGSMREYALYELDRLTTDLMQPDFDPVAIGLAVDPVTIHNGRVETATYLRQILLDEYQNVRDYEGNLQKIVERVDPKVPRDQGWRKPKPYLRVIPFKNTSNVDGGQSFVVRPGDKPETRLVPGVVLSIRKFVMRTAGVIVESLLGKAEALDHYALETQRAVLKGRQLENARLKAALDVVNGVAAKDRPEAYAMVFPRCATPSPGDAQLAPRG